MPPPRSQRQGRLTKGWDTVCTVNRFQDGHALTFELWLEGRGGGGRGGGGGHEFGFIVVGRQGHDVGLLGGGGGAGHAAPWENDENKAFGAPQQHQQHF